MHHAGKTITAVGVVNSVLDGFVKVLLLGHNDKGSLDPMDYGEVGRGIKTPEAGLHIWAFKGVMPLE